jgi:hypothetical protein
MSLLRTKGSGNGLQPYAPFYPSPDGAPLPSNTGGEGEEIMVTSQEFTNNLVGNGWGTPDTYTNHYSGFPQASGVYLF